VDQFKKCEHLVAIFGEMAVESQISGGPLTDLGLGALTFNLEMKIITQ